jgi:hypothetical protein
MEYNNTDKVVSLAQGVPKRPLEFTINQSKITKKWLADALKDSTTTSEHQKQRWHS